MNQFSPRRGRNPGGYFMRAATAGAGEFIPIDPSKTKPRAEVKAFRRNNKAAENFRSPVVVSALCADRIESPASASYGRAGRGGRQLPGWQSYCNRKKTAGWLLVKRKETACTPFVAGTQGPAARLVVICNV